MIVLELKARDAVKIFIQITVQWRADRINQKSYVRLSTVFVTSQMKLNLFGDNLYNERITSDHKYGFRS